MRIRSCFRHQEQAVSLSLQVRVSVGDEKADKLGSSNSLSKVRSSDKVPIVHSLVLFGALLELLPKVLHFSCERLLFDHTHSRQFPKVSRIRADEGSKLKPLSSLKERKHPLPKFLRLLGRR